MNNELYLKSFFIGGYECADHINRSGLRINLRKETHHDRLVYEDYKALRELGFGAVREGICWSEIERKPFEYDFSSLRKFFDAARKENIQIIWDLCHFGYPEGLIPTHPLFPERFVGLCRAFTNFYLENSSDQPWIVPINEISFLAWHSGDMRGTVPFAVNSGWDIKYHLCRAAILGMRAIKEISSNVVILAVEPLVRVHPADSTNSDIHFVEHINNFQYQAMDILLGRDCMELGGNEELIDILGFNYYYNNQWNEHNLALPWPDTEQIHTPLSELLLSAYNRYSLPIILTETGHFGSLRSKWIEEVSVQCAKAINLNVDLRGVCIYPVIDRPDWDDLNSYSNCGLWDLDDLGNRVPHMDSQYALKKSMADIKILYQKLKKLP